MNDHFGILTQRSVHPASPALLTKNGPLVVITIFSSHFNQANDILTHLKFENKFRTFRSKKNEEPSCPGFSFTSNHSLYQIKLFCLVFVLPLLSLGKLRKKPAIRRFD